MGFLRDLNLVSFIIVLMTIYCQRTKKNWKKKNMSKKNLQNVSKKKKKTKPPPKPPIATTTTTEPTPKNYLKKAVEQQDDVNHALGKPAVNIKKISYNLLVFDVFLIADIASFYTAEHFYK